MKAVDKCPHYVGVASLSVFGGNFVLAMVRWGLISVCCLELRVFCFSKCISSMVKSIGGKWTVHCTEVVQSVIGGFTVLAVCSGLTVRVRSWTLGSTFFLLSFLFNPCITAYGLVSLADNTWQCFHLFFKACTKGYAVKWLLPWTQQWAIQQPALTFYEHLGVWLLCSKQNKKVKASTAQGLFVENGIEHKANMIWLCCNHWTGLWTASLDDPWT